MEQWFTSEILAMEKQAVKEKSSGPEVEKEEEPAILEQPTFEEKPSNIEEEKISPQIEEPVKKKFNIRCPQCKHIFITETEEGKITKIKCSKCGKERVVR